MEIIILTNIDGAVRVRNSNGSIEVRDISPGSGHECNDIQLETSLHDAGFPSIGCSPCTRAVGPGEDIRAGRWWWETPEQKECGLHAGKAVQAGEV